MASTIITTNADALKRAARKLSDAPANPSPNHVLNVLAGAIAGTGKNWGFIQGAPSGHYVQPGLTMSVQSTPAWFLFVEGRGAMPCATRGEALDTFAILSEYAENRSLAEADLITKGSAILEHPDYSPIRVHLISPEVMPAHRLHDSPPVRPGVPLTSAIIKDLQSYARDQQSMLIAGRSAVGKTTLLEALSGGIHSEERVVCVESHPELQLQPECLVTLRAEPYGGQRHDHNYHEPLSLAVRQRPDWIVVGELNSDEVITQFAEIRASGMATMTTIHAGSPAGAILRMEDSMKRLSPHADVAEIRRKIVENSGICLCLHRGASGEPHRIETAIVKLDEKGEFLFQPLTL